MSRWAHEGEANPERGRLLMSLLLSLRGSVCLYQGEELGLPEGLDDGGILRRLSTQCERGDEE